MRADALTGEHEVGANEMDPVLLERDREDTEGPRGLGHLHAACDEGIDALIEGRVHGLPTVTEVPEHLITRNG